MRKTDALRGRGVVAMIAEELKNDAPDVWKWQAISGASPKILHSLAERGLK
jgi:hypothetical protein